MIGNDVAVALQELRAQAESLMVDTCIITAGGGTPTWDDANGQWNAPAATTVYEGKCRVQVPNVAENEADAGERAWTVQSALVNLPVSGSESVQVGHTVTITSASLDGALSGRVYTVTADHSKSFATARRLRCEEVTD